MPTSSTASRGPSPPTSSPVAPTTASPSWTSRATPTGASQYKGPYTKVGQDLFDKAVTCDGKTITYHFNKPWKDFNQATAGLLAWAPFRQDQDKGAQSNLAVFSSGPYMLEGTFDKDKGGKFVRNPNWSESTDTVRKAYPDVIQYVNGVQTDTIYQRLMADQGDDKTAISGIQAGARRRCRRSRATRLPSRARSSCQPPYVDYIAAEHEEPGVRQCQGPPGAGHGDQPRCLLHRVRRQVDHGAHVLHVQQGPEVLQGLQPVRCRHFWRPGRRQEGPAGVRADPAGAHHASPTASARRPTRPCRR